YRYQVQKGLFVPGTKEISHKRNKSQKMRIEENNSRNEIKVW
ncbi:MAG: hypothetical protein CI947_2224, partial [Halanaerobium sp.]